MVDPLHDVESQIEPIEHGAERVAAPAAGTVALWGIFLILLGAALYLTRSVVLPVALASLASLVLEPVVRTLRRAHVPPAFGAAILLAALCAALAYGAVALSGPASGWVKRAPESARQIERKLRFLREPVAAVSEATEKMEEATQIASPEPAPSVVVRPPALADVLFDQTQGFLIGLLMTAFLLYLLLAAPDDFLEGVVGLATRLSDKQRIVSAVREIEREISQYLLAVSIINAGFGALVGLAMLALRVPNPALWGVLAAVSNFVPYVGAFAVALVLGGVGVLSFDDPWQMFMPSAAFLVLNVLETNVVTPFILGHRFTLKPAVVFVWVLFCSWLWGVPGGLIAVPLLAATRIALASVPRLAALARLIG